NFESPNPDDSFRSLAEQVLEDIIVGGYGAIEVQVSPGWSEGLVASVENPHFSQNTREVGHPTGEGRQSPHPIAHTPRDKGGAPSEVHASLRLAGRTNASAPTQPLILWPVDGASIRMNLEWDGAPQSQRYLQIVEQSNTSVKLNDEELIYIRLNPRTHT